MWQTIKRILAIVPAVALQLLWYFTLLRWFEPYAVQINIVLSVLSVLFVLFIIGSRMESTYRTLWLIVIVGFPILGAFLYILFGNKRTAQPISKGLQRAVLPALDPFADEDGSLKAMEDGDPRLAQTFRYVMGKTGFPLHACEEVEYFAIGEDLHARMLEDLERAQNSIYAEYFIVEDGEMWSSMVEIMARKAAEGVDVRFMYDDLGSISTYSMKQAAELRKKGIKVAAYNPIVNLSGTLNYRDHRKMLIIDGQVAFSGGINLADEYINRKEVYGHWKDIGFRITGAPVENYLRMFVEFWNAFGSNPLALSVRAADRAADRRVERDGVELVLPEAHTEQEAGHPGNGVVLSYYDSPLYADAVSNTLYIELLSQASHSAWFYTPYLMPGDGLLEAFVRAAQRGVDVRVIMPGIPDKPLIYRMSRSYYRVLLEAGVRIFEYTPGFVHAKATLFDDVVGSVGTVNLDYRSLFLHFENNSLFYRSPLLDELKADFLATQGKCEERTLANIGDGLVQRIVDSILRILAPLC